MLVSTARLWLCRKALIYGLDEHVRGPNSARRTVPRVVVPRRLRSLHLLEPHPFADHVLNAIADDGEHLLIENYIGDVAEPPVTRNDHCAAFLQYVVTAQCFGNGDLDDLVQSSDHALHVSAALEIDYRVLVRHENVARADHIRALEKHDAVSVRMRR